MEAGGAEEAADGHGADPAHRPRTFDQAYNDAAAMDSYGGGGQPSAPPPPPPPARNDRSSGQGNSGLQFGQGASAPAAGTAYGGGGNSYRPPAYVDPYTAPSNTYGNGRAFDSSPHAYVQQNNYAAPPRRPPRPRAAPAAAGGASRLLPGSHGDRARGRSRALGPAP